MKKAVLIGGGVLLVGGLAYLYFANKKKTEKLLSGGATPSTSGGATTSTTPSGTPSGTSSTIDSEIKPLSALDIKITKEDVNFEKAKEIVKNMLLKNVGKSGFLSSAYKVQLKKLGYAYDEKSETLTKL